ncbi:zinc-ribbon domain-containing protein [Brevibacillus reuszeri]|uniref:zinc-ribbon domain-containing protein n=1 Tax=Brevibacillus reuszeri TaxID=54915 RepID=UPI000CCC1092|nr:zinc ribbon domain-containing protein [Brevibacillus reuszeri]
MICTNCNHSISDDFEFCPKCGIKISREYEQVQLENVNNPDTPKHKLRSIRNYKFTSKNIILASVIVILLVLGSVLAYVKFFTIEAKAKEVVNGYLKASQTGASTVPFTRIDSNISDFINVLDYEYISVKGSKQKPKKANLTQEIWERSFKDEYPTFTEFAEAMIEVYKRKGGGKLEGMTLNSVEVTTGEMYDEITLLYNLELTNRLGEKVYKKVEFVVDSNDPFDTLEITKIYYD